MKSFIEFRTTTEELKDQMLHNAVVKNDLQKVESLVSQGGIQVCFR